MKANNRARGKRFEERVRKDIEKKGWIVDRWNNNVETISREGVEYAPMSYSLIKQKYHRFNKFTGFPDFMAYEPTIYDFVGVECKSNGYLTKEEKAKCQWLLDNKIFTSIMIASKGKKRGQIIYKEVKWTQAN